MCRSNARQTAQRLPSMAEAKPRQPWRLKGPKGHKFWLFLGCFGAWTWLWAMTIPQHTRAKVNHLKGGKHWPFLKARDLGRCFFLESLKTEGLVAYLITWGFCPVSMWVSRFVFAGGTLHLNLFLGPAFYASTCVNHGATKGYSLFWRGRASMIGTICNCIILDCTTCNVTMPRVEDDDDGQKECCATDWRVPFNIPDRIGKKWSHPKASQTIHIYTISVGHNGS